MKKKGFEFSVLESACNWNQSNSNKSYKEVFLSHGTYCPKGKIADKR